MSARDHINRAVELLGGPVRAASRLGVARYQTVQQWIGAGRVPAKYCPKIERETSGAVTCEQLLPEVDWAFVRGSQTHADTTRAA